MTQPGHGDRSADRYNNGTTFGRLATTRHVPDRRSVLRGDRQLFGGEQRDDPVALVGDDHLLLDTRRGEAIACRTIGLQSKYHAERRC